jgi:hypothetical protein
MRRIRALTTLLALTLLLGMGLPTAPAGTRPLDEPGPLAVLENFEQVGHDPLMHRGMNAALAVHGDYAYIGSRTDGKANNATNAGVLVVDVSDPAAPEVVHQIGLPHQGSPGETSRELRVWPNAELLIVQNLGSNCSYLIHACYPDPVDDNFRFYDISGEYAAAPRFVAEYDPRFNPHEFFLWQDPFIPERALLFISATSSDRLLVTDITRARQGVFTELGDWTPTGVPGNLHSLGVSNDGMRAYLASLTGGFVVADTSDFANGKANPTARLVTPAARRVSWPGPGAHSAVKLWNRDVALVTDEVYGFIPVVLPGHGCPWGWTRFVDIADPTTPRVIGDYRIPQNQPDFCQTDPPRPSSSYSAHNPTLTPDIALISWHSGGLQAIDLDDPAAATRAGRFLPDPLPVVVTEDPALSSGPDKVVTWSFPIIKDGLIYVVDVRNGLHILRYTGEDAAGVARVGFLEGNSNLGDALLYEPPDPCDRNPVPPGHEEECEEEAP